MAANGNEAVSLSQLKTLSDSIGAEVDGKVASPASAGTAGQVLSTNGTATEWITLPEGTVYTGTAPITVSGSAIGITAASSSADGSMSAADKAKLDGIATGANNYVLPAATASTIGGVKPGTGCEVTGDGTLNVTVTGGGDYEGTAPIVVAGNAISITAASTSAAGSMSAADKAKLDGIADGANNYVLPAATASAIGGVIVEQEAEAPAEGTYAPVYSRGAFADPGTELSRNQAYVKAASETECGVVKFASDTDFNAYMGIS